jgi:hypothetical protein
MGKVPVAQGECETSLECLEQAELEALDLGMRPISGKRAQKPWLRWARWGETFL